MERALGTALDRARAHTQVYFALLLGRRPRSALTRREGRGWSPPHHTTPLLSVDRVRTSSSGEPTLYDAPDPVTRLPAAGDGVVVVVVETCMLLRVNVRHLGPTGRGDACTHAWPPCCPCMQRVGHALEATDPPASGRPLYMYRSPMNAPIDRKTGSADLRA